jgi:hypothetical protein
MIRINLVTYLTFEINGLVDDGYVLSIEEAKAMCDGGNALEALQQKYPSKDTGLDLSMLLMNDSDYGKEAKAVINRKFAELTCVRERKKFGVEKNGLCLLIAYAQEVIQQEIQDAQPH